MTAEGHTAGTGPRQPVPSGAVVQLRWAGRLTAGEADEVAALVAAATVADGRPPVSEAVRLLLAAPRARPPEPAQPAPTRQPAPAERQVAVPAPVAAGDESTAAGEHLLAEVGCAETADTRVPDGGHAAGLGVVGYGYVGAGVGEVVVHPGWRGRGVGAALVGELLARCGGQARVWAHGDHPAARRLAQRHGLTAARVLWRMRRTLDPAGPTEPPGAAGTAGAAGASETVGASEMVEPLPLPLALPVLVLPAGVVLRGFRPGEDERAVVEVNNRAFHWHPEQGGWDVEQIRAREAQPWFDPAGFLLAVDGAGRLLGFHWTKVHGPDLGEVYVLAVDPAEHGRGLGAALTLAGLHHLRGRGVGTVMLYVEADNAPAIRTYRRLGFTHWDSDVQYAAQPADPAGR